MKLPCSPQPRVGVEVAEDAGNALLELEEAVCVASTEVVPLRDCGVEIEERTEVAVRDVALEDVVLCDVMLESRVFREVPDADFEGD